jgi:hypothetical protein
VPLTETETQLLKANESVRKEVKAGVIDEAKNYLPYVVLVLIILLIIKK